MADCIGKDQVKEYAGLIWIGWRCVVWYPSRLESIEAQSFFIPFSIGIMVIAFQKIDTVFEFVFLEFSIYTVIKEILGTGADIDLWEILFLVIALLYTYYKFKK